LVPAGEGELSQLLPEIGSEVGSRTQPTNDPEAARFLLFEAVARFLTGAARGSPILLVLDDLHAADTPSLLLLRYLAAELSDARMLVVATFRPPVFGTDQILRGTVAELVREPVAMRVELEGLTQDAVGSILQQTTGSVPSPAALSAITAETEGNALFVTELGRLLAREGRAEDALLGAAWRRAIPPGVREVIRERLAALPAPTSELMTFASVLGREFSLEALAALAGRARGEVEEALDDTHDLVEPGVGGVGRYRFAHSLIRESIYDGLAPVRRARLHAQAAEALAGLYADDPEPHLAELAHHFLQAAGSVDPTQAIDHARRAAAQAASQLAFEEAVRLLEGALQVAELEVGRDAASRLALLLELGDAQARSGDTDGAKRTFLEAADVARRLGRTEDLARAAVGYGGRFVYARAHNDAHLVPLLEGALARLDGEHVALRIRLLARLAGALRDDDDLTRRDDLSGQAVALARQLADPTSLAYALVGRFAAIWSPDRLDEMSEVASEAARIAQEAGDREREADAAWFPLLLSISIGAPRADLERGLERFRRSATAVRQPSQLWYLGALETVVALSDGRFEEGEELISRTLSVGQGAQRWDALASYRLGLYLLRREQGRLGEIEDMIRRSIGEHPGYRVFRSLLADVCAEAGKLDEASALLHDPGGDGTGRLPKDNGWLFAMSVRAELCDRLEDDTLAASLYEEMLPYADLVGQAAGEGSIGCASRHLGILALRIGRLDAAERHLERALEVDGRMEAHPWLAHDRYDLARVLQERSRPGDADRAAVLLEEAREAAERMGMQALAGRITALGATRTGAVPPAPSAAAAATFRREGEYWSIMFDGDAFRLRDAKGLAHLARLLAEPEREVHALDLVSSGGGLVEGDTGPALDGRAKEAYRTRLAELEEDMEEARSFGDDERVARLEDERSALVDELARSVGLGGRDRRAGAAAERARLNVTRAIRAAIERIRPHSAALATHLDRTVRTGTYCSYRPDPRAAPRWRF
jgi:tetratricopeptide (TPR) repeat protein